MCSGLSPMIAAIRALKFSVVSTGRFMVREGVRIVRNHALHCKRNKCDSRDKWRFRSAARLQCRLTIAVSETRKTESRCVKYWEIFADNVKEGRMQFGLGLSDQS